MPNVNPNPNERCLVEANERLVSDMDPIHHFIVVIDADGNEALYVGGDLVETEGNTVFATDIAKAAGESVIQFSHVEVEHDIGSDWPVRFESLSRRENNEPAA